MSETITFKLRKPLTVDGKTIRELTLHEPTVGDMIAAESAAKAMGGGDLAANVALLAAMADTEVAVIKALPRREFQRLMEAGGPLLFDTADEEEGSGIPAVASAA